MTRLLVVEDDPDAQILVRNILEYMDLEIDVAGDAEDGAYYLFEAGRRYEAIVLDLALPGKDGWEFLAEILANPNTAHLPCIAITAFHTSKLREDAFAAGFSAYFPKPLDPEEFSREMEALLAAS
jgi:CheY-like chemotaxis protein